MKKIAILSYVISTFLTFPSFSEDDFENTHFKRMNEIVAEDPNLYERIVKIKEYLDISNMDRIKYGLDISFDGHDSEDEKMLRRRTAGRLLGSHIYEEVGMRLYKIKDVSKFYEHIFF